MKVYELKEDRIQERQIRKHLRYFYLEIPSSVDTRSLVFTPIFVGFWLWAGSINLYTEGVELEGKLEFVDGFWL